MATAKYQDPVILLRLPEPYRTSYGVYRASTDDKGRILQLRLSSNQTSNSTLPPDPLENSSLVFSDLVAPTSPSKPPASDNAPWARAYKSPVSFVTWNSTAANKTPTLGQIWLLIYSLASMHGQEEAFRVSLSGPEAPLLGETVISSGLARPIPSPPGLKVTESFVPPGREPPAVEILVSRSAFWQGAASPFGPRPAWLPHEPSTAHQPSFPLQYELTSILDTNRPVHAQHPVRPPKPARGSTIYSRYIPALDEFFSMVHLDVKNGEHVDLFHKWQNDPRVAVNWQETGTRDEHVGYLDRMDQDPHQMAVLAKFEDTYFAYFEIYWGKEDHMGTYYPSQDWDRGRHSLVGDTRFRGPHRAMVWWSSIIHYIFLDEPRTTCVVGEPNAANEPVAAYDAAHGFHIHKWGDLPHKRAAMVRCERVRFFEIVNLGGPAGIRSVTKKETKL